MPWAGSVPALVNGYLTGQEAQARVLDVLTGVVNPSGRLAETYARSYEDHPTPPGTRRPARCPTTAKAPSSATATSRPRASTWPFPSDSACPTRASNTPTSASTRRNGATLTVTNTSARDGAEVVQLYVSAPGGVFGPARELKGFTKVEVAAGESVRVTIPFDRYTFRHWETLRGAWEMEAGTWTIHVGRNVVDTPLSATLEVSGTTPAPIDPALGHYLSAESRA